MDGWGKRARAKRRAVGLKNRKEGFGEIGRRPKNNRKRKV